MKKVTASKLLAYQLKKKQSERLVTKVSHLISKEIKMKPKDIAETFADYYKILYDDEDNDPLNTKTKEFMSKLELPTLTLEQAREMTEPSTLEEILNTIKK